MNLVIRGLGGEGNGEIIVQWVELPFGIVIKFWKQVAVNVLQHCEYTKHH